MSGGLENYHYGLDQEREESESYKELCKRNVRYSELYESVLKLTLSDLSYVNLSDFRFLLHLPAPQLPTPIWDYDVKASVLDRLSRITEAVIKEAFRE